MSKKTKLSLNSDQIHKSIACVKGVLELMLAGISGDFDLIDTESVQMLLADASNKLDEVKEALLQGS